MRQLNQLRDDPALYPVKYLFAGEIIVCDRPAIIKTTLGSCVAVSLWDFRIKVGGMNHFMLPQCKQENNRTAQYGNIAIAQLLQKMIRLGSRKEDLQANVFGGAETLHQTNFQYKTGAANCKIALDLLEELKIPVTARSIGDCEGRNVQFYTNTGKATLRFIHASRIFFPADQA